MYFSELIQSWGCHPGYRFGESKLILPNPKLAQSLAMKPGEKMLETQKVFTCDGEPAIYSVFHIPVAKLGETLARRAVAEPSITEPLADFLEICGEKTENTIANVRAELSDSCPFTEVNTRDTFPVLVIEELAFNSDEHPIWNSVNYYPGDRISFDLVRQRGPLISARERL
jgi:DNA-binding GntR family transcriptional regulator